MQVVRNDIQKNYEVKIIWNNTAIMRKLEKSHWKRKQYKIVKTHVVFHYPRHAFYKGLRIS